MHVGCSVDISHNCIRIHVSILYGLLRGQAVLLCRRVVAVVQRVCDKHDPAYYPRFKQWADEYFYCKHRDQRRGLGGIFFDDLNDRPQDEVRNLKKGPVSECTCGNLLQPPMPASCLHLSCLPSRLW